MKKHIALSFLLLGCGQKADVIKVTSVTLPVPGIAKALPAGSKLVPELRTSSILLYPNTMDEEMTTEAGRGRDLAGVGYAPDIEALNWDEVMASLSYGAQVPRGFAANASEVVKGMAVTHIALSISEVRDRSYKEAMLINKELDKGQDEINRLNQGVVAKYPCYYSQVDADDVTSCEKSPKVGDTAPALAFAENCKLLADYKFDFTPEEQAGFDAAVGECADKSAAYQSYRRKAKKEKVQPLLTLRKSAKGICTDMMEKLKEATGTEYLLTASSVEDNEDLETKSRLVLSADGKDVEAFELYLDSGNGKGFVMYDLKNGGIRNLRYYDRAYGVRAMEFTVVGEGFSLEAKLGENVQEPFGYRLIGDVVYRDAKAVRKGVMKLEWDLL